MWINIGDLCPLMGKNCQNIVVYPKMSTIFSKIVRKQRLHVCEFFHVWSRMPSYHSLCSFHPIIHIPAHHPTIYYLAHQPILYYPAHYPFIDYPAHHPLIKFPAHHPIIHYQAYHNFIHYPAHHLVIHFPAE